MGSLPLTFAGIGSRETPSHILEQMRVISELCFEYDYELNSGGADGADTAFEQAMEAVGGTCNIFLPWPGFNGHKDTKFTRAKPDAFKIAASLHPAWNNLRPPVQSLIARNVHQVLGWSLQDPVDFVVCYTSDGVECKEQYSIKTGGTGTAIALASTLDIPVFNLFNKGRINDLVSYITEPEVGDRI